MNVTFSFQRINNFFFPIVPLIKTVYITSKVLFFFFNEKQPIVD